MSTPQQGAVAPYQGQAVTPSAVINSHAVAAHGFLSTISRLVRDSGVFRNESDLLSALSSVEAFGKHLIEAKDRKNVVREHDVAPVEDVRMRKPPNSAAVPQMGNSAPIDYALLAQYIVAAQRQQDANPPEVHEITDAKPSNGEASAVESGADGF